MHTPSFHTVRPGRQSGVVLVVALVMLLLITIVGISAVKTLTLEERMTSNSIDRNAVFQTAEWGLSLAEEVAEDQAKSCNSGFVNQGAPAVAEDDGKGNNGDKSGGSGATGACVQTACQNGLCGYQPPSCPPRWEDSSFTGWTALKNPDAPSENLTTPVGATPQYFIEYLYKDLPACEGKPTDGPFSYRVTVRAAPGEGRASVTLQSIYSD